MADAETSGAGEVDGGRWGLVGEEELGARTLECQRELETSGERPSLPTKRLWKGDARAHVTPPPPIRAYSLTREPIRSRAAAGRGTAGVGGLCRRGGAEVLGSARRRSPPPPREGGTRFVRGRR